MPFVSSRLLELSVQTSPLLHPLSLVIASTSTLTSSTYPVSPRLITQLSCWHFQTESQHVQNQLLISPTPDFFGCSGQKPWSHPGLLSHSPHWSSCGSFFAIDPLYCCLVYCSSLLTGLPISILTRPPPPLFSLPSLFSTQQCQQFC